MLKIASWNVNRRERWDELSGFDIVLVQESPRPSAEAVVDCVPRPGEDWQTRGWPSPLRTAVVSLNPELTLRPHRLRDAHLGEYDALGVSRSGTVTVADVMRGDEHIVTVASVYAAWESPPGRDDPIFADASAHRLLSDLSPLVLGNRKDRLVVAGDLNILRGYGEYADSYWAGRYATVFDRAEAMGLRFVGPQSPHGRQADPWPEELPAGSRNVPTFHHNRQDASTATRQLDFVFASGTIADRLEVAALNSVAEWGSSDHCRVSITLR